MHQHGEYMTLTEEEVNNLQKVINFYYKDEKDHYEESNSPKDHIFKSIVLLKRALHNRHYYKY